MHFSEEQNLNLRSLACSTLSRAMQFLYEALSVQFRAHRSFILSGCTCPHVTAIRTADITTGPKVLVTVLCPIIYDAFRARLSRSAALLQTGRNGKAKPIPA